MFDKETWYDWNGANVWLFKQINSIQGDWYDQTMLLLTKLADHHNFPYYMLGLAAYVALSFLFRKLTKRGGTHYFATVWFATFMVLAAGYAADGVMISTMKDHFGYRRPYIVLSEDSVHVLEHRPADDANHSFPSGHESFATVMVIGLWPVLGMGLGWVGVLFMFGVGWSRIALGVHFPADVLGGFLLTFILMLIVRRLVYGFMRVFLGIKC